MINPVEILSFGGIASILALMCAVIGGGVAALAPLVIGLRKLRWPASVTWLGLVLALVFGVLGTWLGASAATTAVSASPEIVQVAIARAIAGAMYSESGSLLLLGLAFLLSSTATAVPGPIMPGEAGKVDFAAIGGAVAGAVLGTILAVVGILFLSDMRPSWIGIALYVVPFVATVGTVNVLVASLRISSEDRNQQARMVGLRGLTMASAVVAVVLIGQLFANFGEIQAFKAVAVASPDQKAAMLTTGLEVAGWARTLSWFLVLPVLFAGLGSILPHLGRADGRVAIGFGIASAQMIIMAVCLVLMRSAINGIFQQLIGQVTP